MANLLNRIIKISIYLLVFLLPLFFLPFTFEAFEYNKQYLLFFLVSIALFAWLAKMVFCDKEIRFRYSPLDLFVLGFLFIAILSAIFSVDKGSSLFGFYGRFSDGLIGLLSLGVLYFLVTNNIREVKGILRVFWGSCAVVILMSYFSVFGVWARISNLLPLPGLMLQRTFNPVAGSLEGLSIFLAVVVVLLVGSMVVRGEKGEKGEKGVMGLLLFAALGLMAIIDFVAAWLIVLITLFLFIGFSLWKRIFREEVNRLLIPIFLIIIVIFLLPLDTVQYHNLNLPREQILSQSTSWLVGVRAATDNVKNAFLGSGIGTFYHIFAKEKPLEINETWLWQIRFDRPGNHFAEILGTLGFLGILSYLGLIGMFLLISWFLVGEIKGQLKDNRGFQLPLLMVFLALVIGQLVYYQNTTLGFLFWLVLGLSVVSWQKPISEKTISLKNLPELSLVFSTLCIILGVVFLAFYFFAIKFYQAELSYAQSLRVLGEERIRALERAVNLNPQLPVYRLALARAYLFEALTEIQKPEEEQDQERLEIMIARAVDQARTATDLGPNSVANWETLGMIYREIGWVAGAVDWGIRAFERAITLEPINPILYTELGKLYLIADDVEKARENFNRALEKKGDYPEALFQLGVLYFNDNKVDESIPYFQQVLALVPNHANALYSLGLAYSARGETQLAIQAFERVLELHPGNQDVIQRLEELRGLEELRAE